MEIKQKNFLKLDFHITTKLKIYIIFQKTKTQFYILANKSSSKKIIIGFLKIPLQLENSKISSIEGVIKINEDSYLVKTDVTKNPAENISMSMLQAIIFAFIGGIILNLMPCVFPIISLKILSFVSMGGSSKRKIRTHSHLLAWGNHFFYSNCPRPFSFESRRNFSWIGLPASITIYCRILSIVMFIIGLILLMNIEIGTSMTKLGRVGMNQTTYSSSFLTGILAVVVASPCTAPFMGAAIAML